MSSFGARGTGAPDNRFQITERFSWEQKSVSFVCTRST